jgi:hypothetical protein
MKQYTGTLTDGTRSTDGMLRGVRDGMIVQNFIYTLVFLVYMGFSVGNCASKQQQHKNIASGSSG